jgi:hypothetical protein
LERKKTMTETQKQEIQERRAAHHAALETIFPGHTGLGAWRKLRRLEARAHLAATSYCDGDITADRYEEEQEAVRRAVEKLAGGELTALYINGDPRGYALKLDLPGEAIPVGMATDWGGYGILAPEID